MHTNHRAFSGALKTASTGARSTARWGRPAGRRMHTKRKEGRCMIVQVTNSAAPRHNHRRGGVACPKGGGTNAREYDSAPHQTHRVGRRPPHPDPRDGAPLLDPVGSPNDGAWKSTSVESRSPSAWTCRRSGPFYLFVRHRSASGTEYCACQTLERFRFLNEVMSELLYLTPKVSQVCHSGKFLRFQNSVNPWQSSICNTSNPFAESDPATPAIFSFHPLELF